MDIEDRKKKVKGLLSIKDRALKQLKAGTDPLEVRDFVDEAKIGLAYEIPDIEAHVQATNAALKHKRQKESFYIPEKKDKVFH